MKNFIVLLIAFVLFAAPVFSQNGKKTRAKTRAQSPAGKAAQANEDDAAPPPAPPKAAAKRGGSAEADEPPPPPPLKSKEKSRKPSSNVLKDETIGEWGAGSLLIPDDLTNKQRSQEEKVNENVSWTLFSRSWRQPEDYHPSALEVDLTITTWNNPITEVVPDLRPDLATPEHLVSLDLIGDENSKNRPNSPVKEAKALEIANLRGAFFCGDSLFSPNRFTLGWGTYRYHNGKLQNILLSISGNNGELEKALKILQSLKLE